ncbi:MAG TPA: hypothetical protein VGK48_19770 [Terriglobia bacterium]|jgi:hypothetical protein
MRRGVLLILLAAATAGFSFADGCATGTPIATFNVKILPLKGGSAIPLNSVNEISPGEKLRYEPVKLPDDLKGAASVSVILVPASDSDARHFKILDAEPIKNAAEWVIPQTPSAIGLIFGSYGIDNKKITSIVQKHPEIVTKLTDYAEQNTRVEALVQTLSTYEKSPPTGKSLQSVLQGFSTQYGLQMPALDNKTASSEQVLGMLKAIAPAAGPQDPLLASGSAVKAGGLAESVAVSYFGAPVALTVGGAALLETLHSSLFPPTNFRSAFAQPAAADATNLCSAKSDDKETRAHIDYIWMSRIPNLDPPTISLTAEAHLPAGMSSTVAVSAATVAQLGNLTRARDWQLVSAATAIPIPVKITTGAANDTIALDLGRAKPMPGEYQLAANWDWTLFKVNGKVEVHALGNIAGVHLAPDSSDALIAGTGPVDVRLTGTDFEFVDSVSLVQKGRSRKPVALEFTLPKGKGLGNQPEMQAEIDTAGLAPGAYSLAIQQVNGATGEVPITVHPANPEMTQIPLRVNTGEPQQHIILHGTHLERIQKITSSRAEWILADVPEDAKDLNERSATAKLGTSAKKGELINAEIFVSGLENPLKIDGIARVAGPRPRISRTTKSFAGASGVELRDGEIPAGTAVSFALQAQNLDSHPSVTLACSSDGDTRHKISVMPGDKKDSAELDVTGHGSLFLSVDPGVVGDSGCQLIAEVNEEETGTSDPFVLGQVIRLPHITSFTPTDEKVGDTSYAAVVTGQGLQLIEKTGWGSAGSEPVQGIPTPMPGNPEEQTLKIAVPWPPPSPRAPLYVWLRGEDQPRETSARY